MTIFDYTKLPLLKKFNPNIAFYCGRKNCKIILNEKQHRCLIDREIYPEKERNIVLQILKE